MNIKSLAIKSAIGLIGIGGAGGFVAHQLLSKQEGKEEKNSPSIGDKLTSEKYTLLTDSPENGTHWNNILNSYKTIQSELKFEGFDGNDSQALATLKRECSNALGKENKDNGLLNKTRKWCVVPISISDLLTKQGTTPLKTDTSKPDEEKTQWERRISAYRAAKKADTQMEELIADVKDNEISAKNISDLKTKCLGFGKIVSHHTDFEKTMKKFKLWCVNS